MPVRFQGAESGHFGGFEQRGRRFETIDLAMMGSGPRNETWSLIHTLPEITTKSARDFGNKQRLPIRWATFSTTIHPRDELLDRLFGAAKDLSVNALSPMPSSRCVVGLDCHP